MVNTIGWYCPLINRGLTSLMLMTPYNRIIITCNMQNVTCVTGSGALIRNTKVYLCDSSGYKAGNISLTLTIYHLVFIYGPQHFSECLGDVIL